MTRTVLLEALVDALADCTAALATGDMQTAQHHRRRVQALRFELKPTTGPTGPWWTNNLEEAS